MYTRSLQNGVGNYCYQVTLLTTRRGLLAEQLTKFQGTSGGVEGFRVYGIRALGFRVRGLGLPILGFIG